MRSPRDCKASNLKKNWVFLLVEIDRPIMVQVLDIADISILGYLKAYILSSIWELVRKVIICVWGWPYTIIWCMDRKFKIIAGYFRTTLINFISYSPQCIKVWLMDKFFMIAILANIHFSYKRNTSLLINSFTKPVHFLIFVCWISEKWSSNSFFIYLV